MKLFNVNSPELSYKLSVAITKISGFAFYSMKKCNEKFKFFLSWRDYLILISSFSFSFYVFLNGAKTSFNFELKSTILNLGTIILWQVSMGGVIVTKVVNFVAGKRVMGVIPDFMWIDKKVMF